MLEISNRGSRIFLPNKPKPEWEFKFVTAENVEQTKQELEKMFKKLENKNV
ncbi:MAG: hypothetical protein WCY05_05190 [Candidatus Omnitrophota bacterium]